MVLALAAAACGPRTPPPDRPMAEEVEHPAPPAGADPGGGDASIASPSRAGLPQRTGHVARADLNRVLDAGPAAFLARTEVKARVVGGHFRGWTVVRAPYPELDLAAGDVVLSVNGRALEHPLDLDQLWNDLRATNAIDVDLERAGRRFALRFAVVPAL